MKYKLILHKSPETCTSGELASVLGLAPQLTKYELAGVDPTKVHLIFKFEDTGNEMCVSLEHGEGEPSFSPCDN